MKIRIVSAAEPQVRGWYDDNEAVLTLQVCDVKAQYDEHEVDTLLRLSEHAHDAVADLEEFFTDEFGRYAYRVARHFISNHATLEALVYA